MEAIRKNEVESTLISRLEAPLAAAGYQVVDLECRQGPRSLVRIFIERQGATEAERAAVTLQDCTSVSRLLESVADWDGSLGKYDLEVSSPGLDRRLRKRSEFELWVRREIRVWLWEKLSGSGEKFRGVLTKVETDGIELEVDRKPVNVPWSLLRKAEGIWSAN